MRIAHITLFHRPLDSRIFWRECRTLAKAGHEVSLIAPDADCSIQQGVHFHGLVSGGPPGGIGNRLWQSLRRGWQAVRIAKSLRADVCHLHEVQCVPFGLLLKFMGIRIIYDIHEDAFPEKISNARTLGHPLLGYFFAVTAELLEVLARLFFDRFVAATPVIGRKFPHNRTVVVQNFPLLDEIHSATKPERQKGAAATALYLGNVFPNRGLGGIVKALGMLPASSNLRLTVAGMFTPASYQQQLAKLPGWSRVDFVGWRDRNEVADLLSRAGVGLVLFHPRPEHQTAYPNKLFEYMAAGLPVIASDFPLWRSIIETADCGLLVDPLDPSAICSALTRLMDNPQQADQLGANGVRAIRDRFNWQREAVGLQTTYAALKIGRHSPRRASHGHQVPPPRQVR